jgi:hypothetical protein
MSSSIQFLPHIASIYIPIQMGVVVSSIRFLPHIVSTWTDSDGCWCFGTVITSMYGLIQMGLDVLKLYCWIDCIESTELYWWAKLDELKISVQRCFQIRFLPCFIAVEYIPVLMSWWFGTVATSERWLEWKLVMGMSENQFLPWIASYLWTNSVGSRCFGIG